MHVQNTHSIHVILLVFPLHRHVAKQIVYRSNEIKIHKVSNKIINIHSVENLFNCLMLA